MVKVQEKVLVVGPFGFENSLKVSRPRVWIKNLEGPTTRTFTYINRLPICHHPTAFMCLTFICRKWKCHCHHLLIAFVKSKLMQRQNYVLRQVICLLIKFHLSLSNFFGCVVISVASLLRSLITFVLRCEHVGVVFISLPCSYCCFITLLFQQMLQCQSEYMIECLNIDKNCVFYKFI